MLKLIRLEWEKNRAGKYIRNAGILTVLLCVFLFALAFLGIANDPETGVPDTVPGHDMMSAPIELFTDMTFLVFTGVMLSAFIVSAYKNKTMNLMFTYPIKRWKIITSQMMAVWILSFSSLVVSKLVIYLCILAGSRFLVSAFPLDFNMGSWQFYAQLYLKSAVIVSMGFIALFVGVIMKSSKAAVITSFLLILLTQANIGDFTMSGSLIFPIILMAVSILFAFLSVRYAETRDLI